MASDSYVKAIEINKAEFSKYQTYLAEKCNVRYVSTAALKEEVENDTTFARAVELGQRYEHGASDSGGYEAAFAMYEKAADSGQCMGKCYAVGHGVDADDVVAEAFSRVMQKHAAVEASTTK